MANEIEKLNTIAIADIEKFNGKTDNNIEKLNAFEFTGTVDPLFAGTRAVIAGGTGGTHADQNTIAYKTLGASADTVDFGDLQSYRSLMNGAGSNISRAIFAGGLSTGDGSSSVIYGVTDTDYITVGSTGDATDFGNLQTARAYGTGGGASNGTLLFSTGGGNQLPGESFVTLNSMEYFTIASTGTGTDAGNLSATNSNNTQTDGNTRYISAGGGDASTVDTMEYNDFSTSANVSDFGDLGAAAKKGSSAASVTRAVFQCGLYDGSNGTNVMEFVTVASTGNATDFGNLDTGVEEAGGTSNGTLGEFFGGTNSGGTGQNVCQKITIASTGNASDTGDIAHAPSSRITAVAATSGT